MFTSLCISILLPEYMPASLLCEKCHDQVAKLCRALRDINGEDGAAENKAPKVAASFHISFQRCTSCMRKLPWPVLATLHVPCMKVIVACRRSLRWRWSTCQHPMSMRSCCGQNLRLSPQAQQA